MSVRAIARLAKISPAAVSMALHDSPRIPDATKRRVRRLAERLGYKPSAKVRELMSHLRLAQSPQRRACFGVISFYEHERPWEHSLHMQRLYAGMTARAEQLGYRLEPLWLHAPNMTFHRVRAILDTRGIEGLLCFGSPRFDERFPAELDHYAIVTQGLSIDTPLHRVISHAYRDMQRALDRVHTLGYRRPGLVLGHYEDVRNGRAHASAYFGWCEHRLGVAAPLPVLRVDNIEEKPLGAWLKRHKPDVVIFVHHYSAMAEFKRVVHQLGYRVPERLGILAVSQVLEGTELSGLEENQKLMGAWAVELLVARIMNRDLGILEHPRIEMVESCWVDGRTLRTRGG